MGTVCTTGWCFNTLFYPLPSSRCLCRPDVLVCAAEVLCGLPWGKDSEVRTCRVSLQNLGCSNSAAKCCHFHRHSSCAACNSCLHGAARESPHLLGAREELWETWGVQQQRHQGGCRNRAAVSAAPAHNLSKHTRLCVCDAICKRSSFYNNKAHYTHVGKGCPAACDG